MLHHKHFESLGPSEEEEKEFQKLLIRHFVSEFKGERYITHTFSPLMLQEGAKATIYGLRKEIVDLILHEFQFIPTTQEVELKPGDLVLAAIPKTREGEIRYFLIEVG